MYCFYIDVKKYITIILSTSSGGRSALAQVVRLLARPKSAEASEFREGAVALGGCVFVGLGFRVEGL